MSPGRPCIGWPQWLVPAVAAIVLLLATPWGLPSEERMRFLLGGRPLTETQERLLTSLRESYYQSDDAQRAAKAKALMEGKAVSLIEREEFGETLTEADKIAAFRGFVIGSSACDERMPYSALSRMNPRTFDFDPKIYIYGGSYLYPLGAGLFALKALRILNVTSDFSYYVAHPSSIARMYMAGRLLNVAAFVGILVLLTKLGERIGVFGMGIPAALCFLFSTEALNHATISKPHVYAAFWAVLGVYLAFLFSERRKNRYLLLSGLAVGWAAAAAFPCLLLALFYPVVFFERANLKLTLKRCLAAWMCVGGVFLALNPYYVIRYDQFYLTLKSHSSPEGWGYGVVSGRSLLKYLRILLVNANPLPASLLAVVGVGLALRHPDRFFRRLALATVLLVLVVGSTLANTRISLFLFPLLSLYAGYGLTVCARGLRIAHPAARTLSVALVFLPGLCFASLYARDTIADEDWQDSMQAFVDYCKTKPGATLAVFGKPDPVTVPPFPFLNARVVNLKEYRGDGALPDFVLIGSFFDERSEWEKHPLRPRYELAFRIGRFEESYRYLTWRMRNQAHVSMLVFRPRNAPPTPSANGQTEQP